MQQWKSLLTQNHCNPFAISESGSDAYSVHLLLSLPFDFLLLLLSDMMYLLKGTLVMWGQGSSLSSRN